MEITLIHGLYNSNGVAPMLLIIKLVVQLIYE